MNFIQNLEQLHTDFQKKRGFSLKNPENNFSIFAEKGLPTKKNEEYKYTHLGDIQNLHYSFANGNSIEYSQIKDLLIDENYQRVVFVNGCISETLSQLENLELNEICLKTQLQNQNTLLDTYLGAFTDDTLAFVQLAKAFTQNGFFLHVAKNQVIDTPIQILYLTSEGTEHSFNPIRNFVYAEANSKVEIIETHYNFSEKTAFNLGLTEIYSSANAHVLWHKIQNDKTHNFMIDHCYVKQKSSSLATVNTFSFGNQITRNNLDFIQNGEHIQSFMNGISLINGQQLVDHHTSVHHNQPNCESFQTYKGIFDGQSHGVFNGKIFVNKIAQKTNAYQQNNNVLLSKGASIDTKPQLEIFADDVKCSHGCTVGQLNEDALFYLRARGIHKKQAQALLLFAFANDALSQIQHSEIINYIRKLLSEKLHVELN